MRRRDLVEGEFYAVKNGYLSSTTLRHRWIWNARRMRYEGHGDVEGVMGTIYGPRSTVTTGHVFITDDDERRIVRLQDVWEPWEDFKRGVAEASEASEAYQRERAARAKALARDARALAEALVDCTITDAHVTAGDDYVTVRLYREAAADLTTVLLGEVE